MTSASGTAAHWLPSSDRKAYIVWLAIVCGAIVAGFGLDFGRYMAEKPGPPLLLHVHAAVYVLWLMLVGVQIFLVEAGDVKRHRTLGWVTAIVSAAMVPLGLSAALVDQARQIGQHDYTPQFLSLEFEEMFAFSTFIIAGLLWRRNPAAHKRLMILSAIAISDAGSARIWLMGFKVTLPGPLGWWAQYFWGITLLLIAMGAWDLWRRRRIHPAGLAGMAVLWTGEIAATTLNFSPAWKSMMVALVSAWGYRG